MNASALGLVNPESHREEDHEQKNKVAALEALAARMKKSRAKGTSLDYEAPDVSPSAHKKPRWLPSMKEMTNRAMSMLRPTADLARR